MLVLLSVLSDDPIVTIIETNPVVDAVEKKIIAEKNKDVQITCTVENRPKNYEVGLRLIAAVYVYM